MSYADVATFNPPRHSSESDGTDSETAEGTTRKPEHQWNIDEKFIRVIGKKTWFEAVKLYTKHGHGLEKITTTNRREVLTVRVINMIMDFICSKGIILNSSITTSFSTILLIDFHVGITQQTAFEHIRWKDPKSQRDRVIPRMIRTYSNATLVEMITSYLLEESIVPPHPRTLFRLLESFPAKIQKSLRGINPYHEEGMSAFSQVSI